MTLTCEGREPNLAQQGLGNRGFADTVVHSRAAGIRVPLAILGICVAAIVVVTLAIVAIRVGKRKARSKGKTASDTESFRSSPTDPLTELSPPSQVSVYPGLLISASMRYTPAQSTEANDAVLSAEEEGKSGTASEPASRVPSSLLDSSTSHMAVYDDPYGTLEPPTPPPAARVPPVPPLPSQFLAGRALLDRYTALRQAHRAQQGASREARTRHAMNGGAGLSCARASVQTVATYGSARSKHSLETVRG